MRLSDETRAVDLIRFGKETEHQAEIRKTHEDSAMAKAFLKAGFIDLQASVFTSVDDYSPARIDSLLEEVERFKNAILAYKKAENQIIVSMSRINPSVGVAAGTVQNGPNLTPSELSAINKADLNNDARDLVLNRFSPSNGAAEEDASS